MRKRQRKRKGMRNKKIKRKKKKNKNIMSEREKENGKVEDKLMQKIPKWNIMDELVVLDLLEKQVEKPSMYYPLRLFN